jgi:oleandomycin transport system ATP-binding protein
MTYAIQAEGLVKRFGKTTALAGVDFGARSGTVLAMLGPNGAGKTTAVRILATIARPDAGRAQVGGLDVVRDAARVRRMIGLTGQYASVDEDLTAAENLVLVGRLLNLGRSVARARAADLLNDVGLADDADRKVSTYSGGMRRRLDLAACLVGRPVVVFLDEPTTGLDPGRREDMWRAIRGVAAEGGTVLLTTQYMEEADALADAVCVIDHGEVIAAGTPAELKRVTGGRLVTVRVSDPARLEEAADVLTTATGERTERTAQAVLRCAVADNGGDKAFNAIIEELERRGIEVAECSLKLPGLDEVFFALTGHRTVDATAGERAA